jgi:hypothetical protein
MAIKVLSCDDAKEVEVVSTDTSVTITPTTVGKKTTYDLSVEAGGSAVTIANTKTGSKVADLTINGTTTAINETVTTLDSLTLDPATKVLTAQYTGENGTPQTKTVNLSGFVSGVAVTDLTAFTWDSATGATVLTFAKSDGSTDTINTNIMPTFVNTDNQQLTGDTTGSVNLTLTPVVVGGVTNYTIKGDVKVDGTTIQIDPTTKQLKAVPVPDVTTTLTGVQATGKVIGTYTNEVGSAVPIRETLTTLALSGSTLTYTDENGTATALTLPSGGDSAMGSFVVVNRTANFSTGGRSLAQYTFNNAPAARAVGNTSLMTLSGGGILLQPGYRYTVNVRLQVNTSSAWTSYMMRVDGTSIADMYLASGFNGAVSANNRMFEQTIVVDVPSSGAAKTVTLHNFEGDSASSWSFMAGSTMSAQVVGIL